MSIIRVNADYERLLFGGVATPSLNRELEFVAFWLQRDPVSIACDYRGEYPDDYPAEYLDRIGELTGHRPRLTTEAATVDWWGTPEPRSLMSRLNNKVYCFEWWAERRGYEGAICHSPTEAERLFGELRRPCLLKSSRGMSGRGHRLVESIADCRELPTEIFPLVMEPLRRRTRDISALWLPDEQRFIVYENEVNRRFQWISTIIGERDADHPPGWREDLELFRRQLAAEGYDGVFSVDAFFHETAAGEAFHPASELNARRTMGWCAYRFSRLFGPGHLIKYGRKKVIPPGGILLSAPGSHFTWWWVPDLPKKT